MIEGNWEKVSKNYNFDFELELEQEPIFTHSKFSFHLKKWFLVNKQSC